VKRLKSVLSWVFLMWLALVPALSAAHNVTHLDGHLSHHEVTHIDGQRHHDGSCHHDDRGRHHDDEGVVCFLAEMAERDDDELLWPTVALVQIAVRPLRRSELLAIPAREQRPVRLEAIRAPPLA